MNKNICNNCGKTGHQFHQCKLPITSYGIIAFKKSEQGLKYLMIRRKDTFGYIDFIRGKYSPFNIVQVRKIINEMSIQEKQNILKMSFNDLWREMWGDALRTQYKNEENISSKKFETIRAGVPCNEKTITLEDIVKESITNWTETEWEFPKGRRNYQEKDLDCALREFQEETGISSSHLHLIDNLIPFDELYIGSNHKSYKHRYFLGYIEDVFDEISIKDYQKTEVSKIEWKTFDECMSSIRPYSLEKKMVIKNINSMLEEYRLYS